MKEIDYHRYYEAQRKLFGREGQDRIRETRFVLVSLGGIGNTTALFLAVSGARNLVGIDPQVVEPDNLNRYPAALATDVGKAKARVNKEFLEKRFRRLRFDAKHAPVEADEIDHYFEKDVVVISSPNQIEAREHVTQRCVDSGVMLLDVAVADAAEAPLGVIKTRHPDFDWQACPVCYFNDQEEERGESLFFPVIAVTAATAAFLALSHVAGEDVLAENTYFEVTPGLGATTLAVRRRSHCRVCGRKGREAAS